MNVKSLSVLAVVLCIFTPIMFLSEGSDAESVPSQPDADFVATIVSKTYQTDSQSETFHILDMGGDFPAYAEIITGANTRGNLTVDDSGLPTWISYNVPDYSGYDVYFTINPGAPCDEVFWILFDCGGTRILFLFDIVVEDSGSVIPGDNHTFTIVFNTNGGDPVTSLSAESKDTSHTFDISGVTATRDGYTFKGWAADPNGEAMISGSVTVSLSGDSTTASRTVYAVWEENDYSLTIPTFWDGLIELLSNPIILLLGLIMFLAVCLFIRNRTGGYA